MRRRQDKELFKARVFEWAGKLDVPVRSIAIRPMRNKWASCSTAGNLNFNEEVLTFDADVADYVIVHELLALFRTESWKTLEEPDACAPREV